MIFNEELAGGRARLITEEVRVQRGGWREIKLYIRKRGRRRERNKHRNKQTKKEDKSKIEEKETKEQVG